MSFDDIIRQIVQKEKLEREILEKVREVKLEKMKLYFMLMRTPEVRQIYSNNMKKAWLEVNKLLKEKKQ